MTGLGYGTLPQPWDAAQCYRFCGKALHKFFIMLTASYGFSLHWAVHKAVLSPRRAPKLTLLIRVSSPLVPAELPPGQPLWVMRRHVAEVTEDVLECLVITHSSKKSF